LRRTDITDKVLGPNQARAFRNVFNSAQQQLRYVFGMELVELPAREKVTIQQKRAAQKSQSQGQAKAPTQWVLRSILPFHFRDPEILPPAAAPTQGVEGTYTALYSLLVALIMLGGGQIAQAKMERYLRRLGLEDRTPVPGSEKTEKLLKRLEKEGYIREIREKATQGEEDVSYVVGPRGKVEVGERGVEGLVKAVYGDLEGEEEEEELERRIARSLGLGEKARVVQNGEARKKRGRPRRDAEEEDQQAGASGSGSQEDEEGEELYE
jgi:DNA-binding PadR family transcriptional regulator